VTTETRSWIEAVQEYEAELEPVKQRALDAGASEDMVSYLVRTAAMQRYVHTVNNRGQKPEGYASFEEFVLAHGQVFEAPPAKKPRPKGFRKGRDKLCFMNATHAAFYGDEYHYVEGFAVGGFFPVHHAWVTDAEGNVVETTWKTSGGQYFGVPFSMNVVGATIRATNVYGVFNAVLLDQPYDPDSYVERVNEARESGRRPRYHA